LKGEFTAGNGVKILVGLKGAGLDKPDRRLESCQPFHGGSVETEKVF